MRNIFFLLLLPLVAFLSACCDSWSEPAYYFDYGGINISFDSSAAGFSKAETDTIVVLKRSNSTKYYSDSMNERDTFLWVTGNQYSKVSNGYVYNPENFFVELVAQHSRLDSVVLFTEHYQFRMSGTEIIEHVYGKCDYRSVVARNIQINGTLVNLMHDGKTAPVCTVENGNVTLLKP